MSKFCGSCGFQFPDDAMSFCSSCGARRATATGAPQPPAPSPYAPPTGSPTGSPTLDHPVAAMPYDPSAGSGRKGSGKLALGIGALVLAVGGAGITGWAVLGQDGGAGSPEDATTEFLSATTEQDVLGMLDLVLPGEVKGVGEAFEEQEDKLREDQKLPENGLTDAVTLSASEWDLDIEEVTDHVALVTVKDTDLTIEWDLDKLEPGLLEMDGVEDAVNSLSSSEKRGEWPNADFDYGDIVDGLDEVGMTPTFAVVEQDGSWYVSVLGTVQNAVFQAVYEETRDANWHPDRLDWEAVGNPPEPIVGQDSREVVEQVLTAVEDMDLRASTQLLPADQIGVLAASIGAAADALEATDEYQEVQGSLSLELEDWEAEEESIGDDLVEVRVSKAVFGVDFDDPYADEYSYYGSDDSFSGGFRFEDGCVSLEADGRTEEAGCIDDVSELRELFDDGDIVLVLREVDGGMQFDPVATAMHYAKTADTGSLFQASAPTLRAH